MRGIRSTEIGSLGALGCRDGEERERRWRQKARNEMQNIPSAISPFGSGGLKKDRPVHMGRMSHSLISDRRGFLIADKSPFLGCRKKHSDLQTAIRKLRPCVVRYTNMALHFHIRKPHAYIVVVVVKLPT